MEAIDCFREMMKKVDTSYLIGKENYKEPVETVIADFSTNPTYTEEVVIDDPRIVGEGSDEMVFASETPVYEGSEEEVVFIDESPSPPDEDGAVDEPIIIDPVIPMGKPETISIVGKKKSTTPTNEKDQDKKEESLPQKESRKITPFGKGLEIIVNDNLLMKEEYFLDLIKDIPLRYLINGEWTDEREGKEFVKKFLTSINPKDNINIILKKVGNITIGDLINA